MAKTLTVYLAADLKKFNDGMADADRKVSGLAGGMKNMLGPALLGAAAAAGAFALKLGVDGVQAAIEDEASMSKLAKSLENLNMAHDTAAVEDYIGSLESSYGIADSQLRPAYETLARATGSVAEANEALALALDVSAGSGRSLDSVVNALGKAYAGNTGALGKLNAGLDQATLKSGDMEAITGELSTLFAGAATAKAATYEGQLERLKIGAENLTEAFGRGLLDSMGDTNDKTDDLMSTMKEFEPVLESLGAELGNTAGYIADVVGPLTAATTAFQSAGESTGFMGGAIDGAKTSVTNFLNVWGPLAGIVNYATGETNKAEVAFDALDVTIDAVGGGTIGLKGSLTDLTPVLEDNKKTALEAAGSYLSLYEKIAAADRAARDFAGTSGTVTSAIAAGTRGNLPNPNFRADVTPTSVANAISNLVLQSDARSGRAPNIPTSGMGVVFR